MGARGALPQPNNVRQLRGNPGKRTTAPTIKAVAAIPTMPKGLSAAARAEWNHVVGELHRMRILAQLDRALLVAYVRGIARCEGLEAKGKDSTAYYRLNVLPLAAKLALTPNDRLRLKAPDADPGDDEGLD